jgi:SOS-response transcriptional repressor LexA
MSLVPRSGDTKFKVLFSVQSFRAQSRLGPTVEEIRADVGLSSRSSVQFHINDLVSDGYLAQIPGKRRTLRTTSKGDLLVKIIIQEDT